MSATVTEKIRGSWAIVLSGRPPLTPDAAFAGVFFFTSGELNPWQDGVRVALFASRREARAHSIKLRNMFKIRIVKVQVKVVELG